MKCTCTHLIVAFLPAALVRAELSCELHFAGGVRACENYVSRKWDPARAEAECDRAGENQTAIFSEEAACDTVGAIGTCETSSKDGLERQMIFYSGEESLLENECIELNNGTWVSSLDVIGSCTHTVRFDEIGEKALACTSYSSDHWDEASALEHCASLSQDIDVSWRQGTRCETSHQGTCTVAANAESGAQSRLRSSSKVEPAENKVTIVSFIELVDTQAQLLCESLPGGKWTSSQSMPDTSNSLLEGYRDGLLSDETVEVVPNNCNDSCVASLLVQQDAIIFRNKRQRGASKGLLFIPGGDVDVRAYANLCKSVAAEGFFVALIPFPNNLAIVNPFLPSAIIQKYTKIEHWAIAGHSLGGVVASMYALLDPLDRIEMVASLSGGISPEASMLNYTKPYYYVTSKMDSANYVDPSQAVQEATELLLPGSTTKIVIPGGVHSQYGYYATNDPKEPEATISREKQHEFVSRILVHMMGHFGLKGEVEDYIFEDYGELFLLKKPCEILQRIIMDTISEEYNVVVDTHDERPIFMDSFPEPLTPDLPDVQVFHTVQYDTISASVDIRDPPVIPQTTWCKVHSHEKFLATARRSTTEAAMKSACSEANQYIFRNVVGRRDTRTRDFYKQSMIKVDFLDDVRHKSIDEWLSTGIYANFKQTTGRRVLTPYESSRWRVEIQSPSFISSLDSTPVEAAGLHHCKLLTPEAVVQFVLSLHEPPTEASGTNKKRQAKSKRVEPGLVAFLFTLVGVIATVSFCRQRRQ